MCRQVSCGLNMAGFGVKAGGAAAGGGGKTVSPFRGILSWVMHRRSSLQDDALALDKEFVIVLMG